MRPNLVCVIAEGTLVKVTFKDMKDEGNEHSERVGRRNGKEIISKVEVGCPFQVDCYYTYYYNDSLTSLLNL